MQHGIRVPMAQNGRHDTPKGRGRRLYRGWLNDGANQNGRRIKPKLWLIQIHETTWIA